MGRSTTMPRLGKGDAVIDKAFATSVLPRREPGAHKWGVGGLVIIAGAPSYVGAPALCAMAAGRVGAGIVLLAVPRTLIPAIAPLVPEAVYIPLPDGEPKAAAKRARELIEQRLEKAKCVIIGPGLGDDEHTVALLAALFGGNSSNGAGLLGFSSVAAPEQGGADRNRLFGQDLPVVVDADGLNWLARQPSWWADSEPRTMVLTPHAGEMARLLDCSADEVTADTIGAARAAAVRWKQIVVLKHGHSIATDGDRAFVAPDAPTSLASAGTGDALSGMIGAFVAQGAGLLESAALGLYVGCGAARRVEERVGCLGLIASDLPLAFAEELRDLENQNGAARE